MTRDWLAKIRTGKGVTPTFVAFHLGVSEAAYRQWEQGRRTPARTHQLDLATVLDAPEIPGLFDDELRCKEKSEVA